jgi:hypothetical protein
LYLNSAIIKPQNPLLCFFFVTLIDGSMLE